MPPTSPNPFGEEPRRPWRRDPRSPGRRRRARREAGERLLDVTGDAEQAELIRAMLAEAGIPSRQVQAPGTPAHYGRDAVPPQIDVYVSTADLARATELLAAGTPGEDELAELSRRTFEEITGHPPPPDLLG